MHYCDPKHIAKPQSLAPFLKWPGGKRWLMPEIAPFFKGEYKRYIEPFLGSGAIFFNLLPPRGILNDINSELINTYLVVRDDWQELVLLLKEHHELHSTEYYYTIRKSNPECMLKKAARFIYLNRTCFNGLYRVNKDGVFNVPIGTRSSVFRPTDNFELISQTLKQADIYSTDFETVIDMANKDDFLFVDPPYAMKQDASVFVKYNHLVFSWDDQIRLWRSVVRAKYRGCKIVLCNALNDDLASMYRETGFQIKKVNRRKVMAADGKKRDIYSELVIFG